MPSCRSFLVIYEKPPGGGRISALPVRPRVKRQFVTKVTQVFFTRKCEPEQYRHDSCMKVCCLATRVLAFLQASEATPIGSLSSRVVRGGSAER